MQPTEWSTTYNSQFQDRRKYSSPHPGTSNPSYSVRTQAYYGTRAALAEHGARSAEAIARTNGGYDVPSSRQNTWEGSFSMRSNRPPSAFGSTFPQPSTSRFATVGYQTSRVNLPNLSSSYRYNYNPKDLWNAPIEPHTGLYSNYTTISGGVNPKSAPMRSDGIVSVNDYYVDQNGKSNSMSAEWGSDTVDYNTHTSRASSSFRKYKQIEEPKVWNNHHIPGYQGFVRGQQFTHGDTFGKTTRSCLSHPTDVPLEP